MDISQNPTRRKPILLDENNIAKFLEEIDTLICDCDGVIWLPTKEIPNAKEAVDCFQRAAKTVCFVTNNSLQSPLPRFKKLGYNVSARDVVYPPIAVALHLKRIGFSKKAYVIGMEHFKDQLREEGITVVPPRKDKRSLLPEEISGALRVVQSDPEIGAVIVDVDFNLCYEDLLLAANHLRDPECLFFVGASDSRLCLNGVNLLGPGYFVSMLEDSTGRKAELIGKPGRLMVDGYIRQFHNIDVGRTVFVGDTLVQDMGLAHVCGMKKLLVLTGMSKLEDIDSCSPALIPDYYINSFGDFSNLLGAV